MCIWAPNWDAASADIYSLRRSPHVCGYFAAPAVLYLCCCGEAIAVTAADGLL